MNYQCLIWGVGDEYNQCLNQINYEILKSNLTVLALISKDKYSRTLDGYKIISKDKIIDYKFQYIIVFNEKRYIDIVNECKGLGIDESKVINGKVFKLPCFDLERYLSLIENPVTIISDDCWAGAYYNYLGLKFSSPFINMYILREDYLKLLQNLEYYLKQPFELYESGDFYFGKVMKASLGAGDKRIILNLNHHTDFESAKQDWEKRKKRININNLLVKITIDDGNIEACKEFQKLPFYKKVCFTTNNIQDTDVAYIPRFTWKCLNKPEQEGTNSFASYVRNINYLPKSCDILKLLVEGHNYMREN